MEQVARLRMVPGTGVAGPPEPFDPPGVVPAAGAAPGHEPDDPTGAEDGLWHVAVTYAGPPVAPDDLAASLRRLADERPFLGSARYATDRVELRYWEEAAELQDAAALALRLFMDHRRSTGLPDWRVVALEVVDRDTLRAGGRRDDPSPAYGLDDVRPMT